MEEYDYIIIGAGPAGSSAAYYLDKGRVLIVDKSDFPRPKACGGGLLNSMDWAGEFDNFAKIKDDLNFTRADNGKVYLGRTLLFHRYTHFFDHVFRGEFDNLLLQVALEKANVTFKKFGLKSLQRVDGGVVISDGEIKIKGKYIIGADGAMSKVAKFLGNVPFGINKSARCLEYDIHCQRKEATAHISFLWNNGIGYGWVFPTRTGYYIGIGYARQRPQALSQDLNDFMQFCLREKIIPQDYKITRTLSGIDPVMVPKIWCDDRVFLCGDALGLVFQLNGEGIYFAMKSGKIIGQTLSNTTEKDYVNIYRRNIKPVTKRVQVTRWFPPTWLTVPLVWLAFQLIRVPWPFGGRAKLHSLCLNIFLRRGDLPRDSHYKKL